MKRFQRTRLLQLEWQLRSRDDGRLLRCGIFETEEGEALLAGHDADWLWHQPLDRRSDMSANSAALTARRWRDSVLATGAYDDVDPKARV